MSRAFVREDDSDNASDLPELPLSPHPNYVTHSGLAQLHARLSTLQQELAELDSEALDIARQRALLGRERRWLQARIASALLRQTANPGKVDFGATVELLDDDEHRYHYRIVGEDEANPEQGLISWRSPLAMALQGAAVGDSVLWRRPAGDLHVEVLSIDYEAPPPATEK